MTAATPTGGGGTFDRDALFALYRRLRIPGVCDAHCHFMPQEMFERVWRWFDEEAPTPWPITYRGDEDIRRKWLERCGVVRYTSLNYAHRAGVAAGLNDWTLELLDRDPKVFGTATFYPEPEAAVYIERVLRDPRIKGFKLHLQVGGFHPDDPLLRPCYERIRESGRVLIIHAGSAPLPGTHTNVEAMTRMLDRFPGMKVVIAHMGAYESEYYLDLATRREHLYLDTAMAFTDFEATGRFPEALHPRLTRLKDRILFGSDYPNIPFPFEHAVESVLRLGQGDGWLKAVLHDNALRLFGGVG